MLQGELEGISIGVVAVTNAISIAVAVSVAGDVESATMAVGLPLRK